MAWRISNYVAEELVSSGGSGEVWRGKSLSDNGIVAIKRLRPEYGRQAECLYREAVALSTLDHPNMQRLREVVATKSGPVLVCDFAENGSLAQVISSRGALSSGEVISVIVGIASALTYLHSAGLIHADVTPANILFSLSGRPLLADFGLTHAFSDSAGQRDAWSPAATWAYADPTVMAGGMPSPATDVFMLAATAFHALTGNALAYRSAKIVEGFANIAALDPCVPADLNAALKKALTINPAGRGTADELARTALWSGPSSAVHIGQPVLGFWSSPPPAAPTCPLPRPAPVFDGESATTHIHRPRWGLLRRGFRLSPIRKLLPATQNRRRYPTEPLASRTVPH